MSLTTHEELAAAVAGKTVGSEFVKAVQEWGDRIALRWKAGDEWHELTFEAYGERAGRIAAGLGALGVGKGDRVVLMMRNTPEFHILDMGTVLAGATPISIYNSSAPDQVEYLAGHCGAKVAIVEDVGFLERFLKVRDQLPALEHLVIINDPDTLAPEGVLTYDSLLAHEPVDLADAANHATSSDLATVIYTSGTTGPPKGVMISHFNVLWTGESFRKLVDLPPGMRVISYLPMAHIAERFSSHYMNVLAGVEVTTCPDPGLIAGYLGAVKPQLMFGVPRVWEKLYAAVNAGLAADPEKQQKFNEAIEAAKPISLKMAWGTATDEEKATYEFLDAVAFLPVRQLLGLDALEYAITGAAPIPAEMLSWFRAVGIPMAEVYGMSENTGPLTYIHDKIKPGTVGPALPGVTVALADDGEVIAKGGNVFRGYLNDPAKTAEALAEDGWLHTGDIGELDQDGYLRIVDRKKELIITAGGKNISPANLEAALKLIPLVGQACAIGDQRPFVSALLVLDPEVAPAWARQQGIEFTDLADLAANERVRNEIEGLLPGVMQGFNNAERVKKVAILGDEWLPDSEELTPTSKLKRRGIHAKYADVIESLYS